MHLVCCTPCICLLAKFHLELEKIKRMSSKGAYLQKSSINIKAIKVLGYKPKITTVPKKQLRIILPYLGNVSYIIRNQLVKTFIKNLKLCNLKFVFGRTKRKTFVLKIYYLKLYVLFEYINFHVEDPNLLQLTILTAKFPGHKKLSVCVFLFPSFSFALSLSLPKSVTDHMLTCDILIYLEVTPINFRVERIFPCQKG